MQKIPPPLVMILSGVIMWFVAASPFGYPVAGWVKKIVAVVFALDGFAVMALAVVQFKRHQTTIDPIDPSGASSLVTAGIYQWTRNRCIWGWCCC